MKLEQENGWVLTTKKNFSCKNPVFIEGLPGVANVGKIVVDYMIDLLGAKKIGSIVGNDLPNSVFVMPNGLVHLPVVELFHYNHKGRDFIFLVGFCNNLFFIFCGTEVRALTFLRGAGTGFY
jgi:proteasome assembly chaperone (PAC2) family protein